MVVLNLIIAMPSQKLRPSTDFAHTNRYRKTFQPQSSKYPCALYLWCSSVHTLTIWALSKKSDETLRSPLAKPATQPVISQLLHRPGLQPHAEMRRHLRRQQCTKA